MATTPARYTVEKVNPRDFGKPGRPFWVTVEHREGFKSVAVDRFATKREAREALRALEGGR